MALPMTIHCLHTHTHTHARTHTTVKSTSLPAGAVYKSTPYNLRFLHNETCKLLCVVNNFANHAPSGQHSGHPGGGNSLGAPIALFRQLVRQGPYLVNLKIDNVAAIRLQETELEGDVMLIPTGQGYPLGFADADDYYVVNHVTFYIAYRLSEAKPARRERRLLDLYKYGYPTDGDTRNTAASPSQGPTGSLMRRSLLSPAPAKSAPAPPQRGHIVGVYVAPATAYVDPRSEHGLSGCEDEMAPQRASGEVVFTYSVKWVDADSLVAEVWGQLWEEELAVGDEDERMSWISLSHSLAVVFILAILVALILFRALRQQLARYNRASEQRDTKSAAQAEGGKTASDVPGGSPVLLDDIVDQVVGAEDDLLTDRGWKVVAGDVFRGPPGCDILSSFVGTGVQCVATAVLLVLSGSLGYYSSAREGSLTTAVFVLYGLTGVTGGFVAARCQLRSKGKGSKVELILRTATLLPAALFATFVVLDLAIWRHGSSGAVPFGTMLVMITLWLCLLVPLVALGAIVGFSMSPPSTPVNPNHIPRGVPDRTWLLSRATLVVLGGFIVFTNIFAQTFLVFGRLWLNPHSSFALGFLAALLLTSVTVCAEVSIIATYIMLSFEDWRWWWTAFLAPASSGIYLFGGCLVAFLPNAASSALSAAILIGYAGMLSMIFALAAGAVGFLASLALVHTMYHSVKLE
eukprot:jgi/Mesvir1/17262/Mv07670-RA.1